MINRRNMFGISLGGIAAGPSIARSAVESMKQAATTAPFPEKYWGGPVAGTNNVNWLPQEIESTKRHLEEVRGSTPPAMDLSYANVEALKSVSPAHRQQMVNQIQFEQQKRRHIEQLEQRLIELGKQLVGL